MKLLLLPLLLPLVSAQDDRVSYSCDAFADGDQVTCEACLENDCGWNEGVCVTLCDFVLQGTCHSLKDPTETRDIAESVFKLTIARCHHEKSQSPW